MTRDLETWETQPAQSQDNRDLSRWGLPWAALRPGRTIAQPGCALGPETGQPFVHAPLREAGLERGGFGTELLSKDGTHDSFSTMHRQARIMMNVHVRVGFDGLDVSHPPLSQILPRMNNLLKHHS